MKQDHWITLEYVRDTDLDVRELEQTLIWKRNLQAAQNLAGFGFRTRMESEQAGKFLYILVYPPIGNVPAVWATADEVIHLCDFARNLTPEEAWNRWVPTVEPFEELSGHALEEFERETDAMLRRLPHW